MPRRLKLMTDYGCHPIWDRGTSEGEFFGDLDPATLPLTPQTVQELRAWADWYDTWIDMSDPHSSRHTLPEEETAFRTAGLRLWRTLRRELGETYRVTYFEGGHELRPEDDQDGEP